MRDDVPSLTARGVAVARSALDRPRSPAGDPAAEQRLTEALLAGFPRRPDRPQGRGDFASYIGVRTKFFDDAVAAALVEPVPQIVILGAGYDGRALRFRTPGVQFFEVDHPATQADKRRLLADVDASTEGITFVAADFTKPGLGAALAAAGHDAAKRSLFVCEGVLRYLPEVWFRALLADAAEHSAAKSNLAVSISTRGPDVDDSPSAAEAERERRLAATGEPVLTVPEREVALEWLAEAGWNITRIGDVSDSAPGTRAGRLLVDAER